MQLEDQVCSLELAKKLKELGVKQESLFHWGANIRGEWSLNSPTRDRTSYCSAFTVAELGEMLPEWIKHNDDTWMALVMNKHSHHTGRMMYTVAYSAYDHIVKDFSEANARALMLIHLIEQGYYNDKDKISERDDT